MRIFYCNSQKTANGIWPNLTQIYAFLFVALVTFGSSVMKSAWYFLGSKEMQFLVLVLLSE